MTLPSGYDPTLYRTERIAATAADGVEVPISLVYRSRPAPRAGGNPVLLYGYGSYGASIDPGFNRNVLSLLDRGWMYAIAHVRGGSELGRAWYNAGKLMNKRNTFDRFHRLRRAVDRRRVRRAAATWRRWAGAPEDC